MCLSVRADLQRSTGRLRSKLLLGRNEGIDKVGGRDWSAEQLWLSKTGPATSTAPFQPSSNVMSTNGLLCGRWKALSRNYKMPVLCQVDTATQTNSSVT